jgi:hypothetical protein
MAGKNSLLFAGNHKLLANYLDKVFTSVLPLQALQQPL